MDSLNSNSVEINLGWANGWNTKPAIIRECENKKHIPEFRVDHQRHIVIVRCAICRYMYSADSS